MERLWGEGAFKQSNSLKGAVNERECQPQKTVREAADN